MIVRLWIKAQYSIAVRLSMSNGGSVLGVFMEKMLGEFSPIGRLALFFGTILVLSAIVALGRVRLLFGFDLILLAIADWIWRNRDTSPYILFPHESVARYRRQWFYRFFWAALFFVSFVALLIYLLRLPEVMEFLTPAQAG